VNGLRKCSECGGYIPPETKHVEVDGNDVYHMDCVEVVEYTDFYINGKLGDYLSNSDDARIVEEYEDEYEGEDDES
jgi:hypothetical protein